MINEKVLLLERIGSVILSERVADAEVRQTIYQHVSREQLAQAVAECSTLAQPSGFNSLAYAARSFSYLHQFTPRFLDVMRFRSDQKSSPSAIQRLFPRRTLPELLVEVHGWTGFADHLTSLNPQVREIPNLRARTLYARVNPHAPEKGASMNVYTHVADNLSPFYSQLIESTSGEAAYILDGLLYHETDLRPREHYPGLELITQGS